MTYSSGQPPCARSAAGCYSGGQQMPPIPVLHFTLDAARGMGTQEWARIASQPWRKICFMCQDKWQANIRTDMDEKGAAFKSFARTSGSTPTVPHDAGGPQGGQQERGPCLGEQDSQTWHRGICPGGALMIVSALLECQLYVGHTKQYTMAGSYLANCLTRDTTASEAWATVQNVTLKDPLRTCGAGLRTRLPTGSWASS